MKLTTDIIVITLLVILLLGGIKIIIDIDSYETRVEKVETALGNFVERDVEGTGSMRPLLEKRAYPNLSTINEVIGENDSIHLGRIYIYKKDVTNETNTTTKYIIHRLLGIYNVSDEILFIFKGDNNIYLDEPVYREQIIEEAVRINLR